MTTVVAPPPGTTQGPGALQWFVDSYSLAFAALLLIGGAFGDRYGGRLALAGGLAVFGVASVGAASADGPTPQIAARDAMGIGGALIMPATLSHSALWCSGSPPCPTGAPVAVVTAS